MGFGSSGQGQVGEMEVSSGKGSSRHLALEKFLEHEWRISEKGGYRKHSRSLIMMSLFKILWVVIIHPVDYRVDVQAW